MGSHHFLVLPAWREAGIFKLFISTIVGLYSGTVF